MTKWDPRGGEKRLFERWSGSIIRWLSAGEGNPSSCRDDLGVVWGSARNEVIWRWSGEGLEWQCCGRGYLSRVGVI